MLGWAEREVDRNDAERKRLGDEGFKTGIKGNLEQIDAQFLKLPAAGGGHGNCRLGCDRERVDREVFDRSA